MIVCPSMTLRALMTAVVEATHGLSDELGAVHIQSTIAEANLRQAALVALQIATGEHIWPGDRAIRIRRAKVRQGIFEEEG